MKNVYLLEMIDLKVYNKLEPKKGRLLITEPFEASEYFSQAVILLCEHNENGSFGFVLNNYSPLSLEQLEILPEFNTRLSVGGPVSNKNLYYIHTLGDKLEGSIHVAADIYVGGDFEQLKEAMSIGLIQPDEVRFFLGYSGWVAKQLDGELKQNAWLVADIHDTKEIMDFNENALWRKYMERQGGKYKAFAHFPKNPEFN